MIENHDGIRCIHRVHNHMIIELRWTVEPRQRKGMRALLGLHLRIIFLCCATSSFLSFKIHKHSKLVSTQYSHRVGSCLYGSAADEDDDSDTLGIQPDFFKSGFVSILGNPNVGKSTLMNAILREKLCIVSPKPQTTRHRILGVVTENDHQLVFSGERDE